MTTTTCNAAAEFFKNKKKKGTKKIFTFNANLVDVDAVTQQITHVDAPALSYDPTSTSSSVDVVGTTLDSSSSTKPSIITPTMDKSDGLITATSEWDETAVVSSIGNSATTTSLLLEATNATTSTLELGSLSLSNGNNATTTGSGGVSNMGTLSTNEYYDDTTIAEKLRVEETRAQLASARIGMERQAAAAAAAAALKEEEKKNKASTAAKAATPSTGGKWIPSHMRNQTAATTTKGPGGGRFGNYTGSTKLDVASNELFPDLQTSVDQAEKEKQSKQQQPSSSSSQPSQQSASKMKISMKKIVPSLKTPLVASIPVVTKKPKVKSSTTKTATTTDETKQSVSDADVIDESAVAPTTTVDVAPSSTEQGEDSAATNGNEEIVDEIVSPADPVIKKSTITKKKKKDLSTFKVSS